MLQTLKKNSSSAKLVAISAFLSVLLICFLHNPFKSTAVTWPASDNLPGVCRLLDPTCLTNDFFTNASSGITPRLPYIYFLSEITRIVDNGIGGGVAVVKACLLVFFPIVISLLLFASVKTHTEDKIGKQWVVSPVDVVIAVSAPLFVFFLQSKTGASLSVAWWVPLYFDATPHNVSLLLTIFGFLTLWLGVKGLGAVFIFSAAILHPAISLFSSLFACILLCKFKFFQEDAKFLLIGLGATLLGAVLIKIFFDIGGVMSAEDFVKIYAFEAHPSHYIPSQFGSLGKMPWMRSFLIVSLGLLTATIILYKLKSTAWKNALLALLAYSGAVAVQFLFVEVMPTKLIAALGPSRFTMFGPWFLFIFNIIILAKLLNRNRYFCLQKDYHEHFLRAVSLWLENRLASIRWIYIGSCYLVLGAIIAFFSLKLSVFDLPDDAQALATFATTQTSASDVFVLPFYAPRFMFPLKTGRAIFHGNGFPFSENSFFEWDDRNAFVNGRNAEIAKLPGSWIGDQYANHYRSLTPSDFVEKAKRYKMDWIIVEADYSEKFSKCKADFDSSKYRGYSLSALKDCVR
jgi:hypothetical protein